MKKGPRIVRFAFAQDRRERRTKFLQIPSSLLEGMDLFGYVEF